MSVEEAIQLRDYGLTIDPNVVICDRRAVDEAADKLEELAAENERLLNLCDKLRQQAQIHSMEARGANATIAKIYQAATGRSGEPGNWNGAEPVIASLAEKAKEIAALRELVDSAESIFINCSVTDGMCCCGDNMENHHSPMSCGHTPVDHGAYQVDLWIKARNAGGKDGE